MGPAPPLMATARMVWGGVDMVGRGAEEGLGWERCDVWDERRWDARVWSVFWCVRLVEFRLVGRVSLLKLRCDCDFVGSVRQSRCETRLMARLTVVNARAYYKFNFHRSCG